MAVDFIKEGSKHIWLPYTQMQLPYLQLEAVSASGVRITLKNGQELIDGISSWWSMAHGYNHPELISALKKQADILPHIMLAGFANEQTYKLACQLVKITPLGLNKVFFSDSGSTAVEVAIKIALQFFLNQRKAEQRKVRHKLISFHNAYHGDTAGCMALSDVKGGMHQKFGPYLPSHYNVPLPTTPQELNQFEDFIKKTKEEVAAVIIEPLVQCAGGMKFHSPLILKEIYNLTKKHGLLFIADECATGFFRTGHYFACNQAEITPDIMILGKALTGGVMTLAATLTSEEIYQQFLSSSLETALMHGPTFMGNPLAAAAANASIELFNNGNYQDKSNKIESILSRELNKCRNLPGVTEVRVMGAIGVVETDYGWPVMLQMRKEIVKRSVWLRPFAGVIYIMPPLVIEEPDLVTITDAVQQILSKDY